MKRFLIFAFCSTVILVNACQHYGETNRSESVMRAELVYGGAYCGSLEKNPSALWIKDSEQLSLVYKKLHSGILGAESFDIPQIDFEKEGVLLVEMGQKPTGGYQLILKNENVAVSGKVASLNTSWIEPAPDTFVPQVITSPCILVKLPVGDYLSIKILDQANTERILLKISED